MRALVTGGGGFIGRHVVARLCDRGDEVRVLARGHYPELAAAGVEVRRGDIQDLERVRAACEGIDVVFHVAARAGVWGTRQEFFGPNVTGTRHVLGACRSAGVPRLVFTSSPSVVFDNRPHQGSDETLPYPERYENYYAETKALAERLVTQANGAGLSTVSLRPHLVFGPGDPHLLPRVLARARTRALVRVGDGRNRVDLSYIEDVARAHVLAADALGSASACDQGPASIGGSSYFITQDEPVMLWQWVEDLLARLALPPVRGAISLPLARALGTVLEALHRAVAPTREPRLTRFVASELALDHYYDISRAKHEIGFTPALSMSQATDNTVDWLRRKGELGPA